MNAKERREAERKEEAKLKAFFEDIRNGRLAAVRKHVERTGNLETPGKINWVKANPVAWTPLQAAVYWGQPRVAEYLIGKGADVNARVSKCDWSNHAESTPLMIASEKGNIELVRLLVTAGADLDARRHGASALGTALCKKSPDVALLLMDAGSKLFPSMVDSALSTATALHTIGLFKHLVEMGKADLSKYPDLFKYAAERGRLDVIQMMVEAGADVNAFTKIRPGWPVWEPMALMRAAYEGHEDVVLYLLKMGADEKVKIVGRTAKRWATVGKNHRIARLLQNADKLRAEWGVKVKRAKPPVEPKPQKPMSYASAIYARRRARSKVAGNVRRFIKQMSDGQDEWSLVAVKAPFEAVAEGCCKLWNLQLSEKPVRTVKPTGKMDSVDENPFVVQLKDQSWTVVFRSLFTTDMEALDQVEDAARQLSKQLATISSTFVAEGTSGAVGYKWFEKGSLVEHFESETGSPAKVIALFAELGINVPACYTTPIGNDLVLAVEYPGLDAVEKVAAFESNPD